MIAILLLAAIVVGALAVLLARYGAPTLLGQKALHLGAVDVRPPIPASSLRALTVQLLAALKMEVAPDTDPAPNQRRLLATRKEPLAEIRYVVDLAPSPPGGVVDQAAVLSLAEDVKGERATVGLLITPGEIETAGLGGLEVTLELIDGPRFRALIAQYLPQRLGELDRYQGFAARALPLDPLRPQTT